jgi:hypothetical protein
LTKASSIGFVVRVGGGTVAVMMDLHTVLDSNTRATVEAMMLVTLLALDLTL